jgi:hypothetical protein
MAKNLYETADDTLRGEAGGQLTPEAQSLWDRYNSVYGNVQSMPTKTVKLRSGATMPILDPGMYYRQRALQKVLGGMSGTGLGTRNAAQPGALSQLAPFVSALGSDPKFQKWLAEYFGRSSGAVQPDIVGSPGDNWSQQDFGAQPDIMGSPDVDWGDFGDTYSDWEW